MVKKQASQEHPSRPLYSSVRTIPTPHGYATEAPQNTLSGLLEQCGWTIS
jgi:hypothetical protein